MANTAPNWRYWRSIPEVTPREAVSLSLGIEPQTAPRLDPRGYTNAEVVTTPFSTARAARRKAFGLATAEYAASPDGHEFMEREAILRANIGAGRPLQYSSGISYYGHEGTPKLLLRQFAEWADDLGWEIPRELQELNGSPSRADLTARVEAQSEEIARLRAQLADHWPWGAHETALLRQLAAAADRFWKNFDPKDHGTAPRNQDVIEWLTEPERGVPKRVAEIMAQILRADSLPAGRRR